MVVRLQACAGEGRYLVEAAATVTADGVNIEVLGGEQPHVGAVAFGVPRPSLEDPHKLSSNVTVVPRLGHRDDEIARSAAAHAARKLGVPVVVVVGIHIERARPDEITLLVENGEKALDQLLNMVKASLHGEFDCQSQDFQSGCEV